MKRLLGMAALLLGVSAHAGTEVGNGGGAWVCRSARGEVLHAEVLDLYEAGKEFGLTVPVFPEKSVDAQVAAAEAKLQGVNPILFAAYLKAKVLVTGNLQYIKDSHLEVVHDYFNRIRPAASSCAGVVNYEQLANFTRYGGVLVDPELWKKLDSTQQAALIVHESLYAALRSAENAQNSIHARRLVGILFSTADLHSYFEEFKFVLYDPDHPAEAVLSVEVGSSFACVIFESGRVKCWGNNRLGQLGDFAGESSEAPVLIAGIEDAVKVLAGTDHGCAITGKGRLKCWGSNDTGQLGLGFVSAKEGPRFVPVSQVVVDAVVGHRFTCAILLGGAVQCWGVTQVPKIEGATSLWTDGWRTCALKDAHRAECWGVEKVSTFALPKTAIRQLRISDDAICALGEDHSVWCRGKSWVRGKGCTGQSCLGGGSGFSALRSLRGSVGISAGRMEMFSLGSDGRILHWGETAIQSPVGDLFRQISSSPRSICGLHQNGQVKCWGALLGKDKEPSSAIPVVVKGL